MVYTPQKAASAIIASQVMRRIPRLQPVGPYPENTTFGDFRVSYEENLSELVSADLFYYSNNTRSRPPSPSKLRRIVGFGSSSTVHYEGVGLYFLDKIEDGAWRLEVYPDSLQIDDPFAPTRIDRLVFQLIARAWPMTVDLPDLGASFRVEPLNAGNSYATRASGRTFTIRPGVYLLSDSSRTAPVKLPDRLPGVPYYLGMREFVCPESSRAPTSVVLHTQSDYPADKPVTITATVAAAEAPDSVTLQFSGGTATAEPLAMPHLAGYDYGATLAPGALPPGEIRFTVSVSAGGKTLVFPHDSPVDSNRAESYRAAVVPADAPVVLFDAPRDFSNLSVSRSGESRNRIAKLVEGSQPGTTAYPFGVPTGPMADDFTASLYVGDRLAARGARIAVAKAVHLRLKGIVAPSVIRLTLVERDGSGWSGKIFAPSRWTDVVVPIASLRSAKSAMVPQGYPGTWSYWLSPPAGRTSIDLAQVERLQFSLRKDDFGSIAAIDSSQAAVAIESVSLDY
jgi:hypothetical protein